MNETEKMVIAEIRCTTRRELEELEMEKINKIKKLEKEFKKEVKTIANLTKELFTVPKEMLLPYLLKYDCQLIKQAKEKKVS